MRSDSIVTVLSVSPVDADHRSLENILGHSHWALERASCVTRALDILRTTPIGAIVCERDLPPLTWIDLIQGTNDLPEPPPLIVTSRLADEALWTEALRRGAHDVLSKPFDRVELIRSISTAWRHWQYRKQCKSASPLVMRAAG